MKIMTQTRALRTKGRLNNRLIILCFNSFSRESTNLQPRSPKRNRSESIRSKRDRKNWDNQVHNVKMRVQLQALNEQINKYEGFHERTKLETLSAAARILEDISL